MSEGEDTGVGADAAAPHPTVTAARSPEQRVFWTARALPTPR
jgi:hypothetical protein